VTGQVEPARLYLIDTSAQARLNQPEVRRVIADHRAAGVIDLLTAAVAEHHGAVVLHYAADFEHIAAPSRNPGPRCDGRGWHFRMGRHGASDGQPSSEPTISSRRNCTFAAMGRPG